MPEPGKVKNGTAEKLRINRAFQLSLTGILLAVGLVVFLVCKNWGNAAEITAVVGLFTSVLGTLIGAFFGLQIGSEGRANAEARADKAQKEVEALKSVGGEPMIERVRKFYPDLFSN
jgi:uncharacterized membrane protein